MSTDRGSAAVLLTLVLVVSACAGGEADVRTDRGGATSMAGSSTLPAVSSSTSLVALPEPRRVDDLLGECPSRFDVDFVSGRIDLVFDDDPTAPILVCEESDGSADLTRLRERAVQALLVMEATTFEEPLPWTDLGLFDWLVTIVDGIRFRDDIDRSSCCDPEGYINVPTANLAALGTNRWIDPTSGTGLLDLVALFIHEARHAEGFGHTCDGENDPTVADLGAWAVEALLYRWYADHADATFFDDPQRPGFYGESADLTAKRILATRFCN